jgi:hypothetical protein
MHELLRERLMRKLDTLPEERVYQVLDYIEFLESKYARAQGAPTVFQRFADGVEDTMRAGRLSASTIAETMSLMSKAMGVLSGAMAAGKSVASDVVTAARAAQQPPSSAPTATPPAATGSAPSAPAAPPNPTSAPAAGSTSPNPTPSPSTTGETPA